MVHTGKFGRSCKELRTFEVPLSIRWLVILLVCFLSKTPQEAGSVLQKGCRGWHKAILHVCVREKHQTNTFAEPPVLELELFLVPSVLK